MTDALVKTSRTGAAFDAIAQSYDEIFTDTLVGRAQRQFVWQEMDRLFRPGNTVLDLNCGTGEDALHLARRGVRVVGCDASEEMVKVARRKLNDDGLGKCVQFYALANEELNALGAHGFDGVISNFAGLNCVGDLGGVARQLSELLAPGGYALLCVYGRLCLWEVLFYGLRGSFGKALRRFRSQQAASLRNTTFPIYYWSIAQLKRAFAPWFQLRHVSGVGVAVPPSYVEEWATRHRSTFRRLVGFDTKLSRCPGLRRCGDHLLLSFERLG